MATMVSERVTLDGVAVGQADGGVDEGVDGGVAGDGAHAT